MIGWPSSVEVVVAACEDGPVGAQLAQSFPQTTADGTRRRGRVCGAGQICPSATEVGHFIRVSVSNATRSSSRYTQCTGPYPDQTYSATVIYHCACPWWSKREPWGRDASAMTPAARQSAESRVKYSCPVFKPYLAKYYLYSSSLLYRVTPVTTRHAASRMRHRAWPMRQPARRAARHGDHGGLRPGSLISKCGATLFVPCGFSSVPDPGTEGNLTCHRTINEQVMILTTKGLGHPRSGRLGPEF